MLIVLATLVLRVMSVESRSATRIESIARQLQVNLDALLPGEADALLPRAGTEQKILQLFDTALGVATLKSVRLLAADGSTLLERSVVDRSVAGAEQESWQHLSRKLHVSAEAGLAAPTLDLTYQPVPPLSWQLKSLSAVIVVVGCLASILLALVVVRTVVNPIHLMIKASKRMEEGDLHARADVHTGDELGLLADSFNTMLAELRGTRERLSRHHRVLAAKVDLQTQQLSQATDRLRELDRMKDLFLASISQEIGQPIRTVQEHRSALVASTPPHSDRDDRLQGILSQCGHLEDLLQDILDLTTHGGQQLRLTPEEVDPRELMEEVLRRAAPEAESRGIQFRPSWSDPLRSVCWDAAKVSRTILQMLNEAQGHAPAARAKVAVSVEQSAEHTFIEMKLPAKAYRTESLLTHTAMTVWRRVIVLHNGSLEVAATREGGGLIRLQLPDRPAAVEPLEVVESS
jgi:signal transduction histidine kinase